MRLSKVAITLACLLMALAGSGVISLLLCSTLFAALILTSLLSVSSMGLLVLLSGNILVALVLVSLAPFLLRAASKYLRKKSKRYHLYSREICDKQKATGATKTLGFFHPYCNAGGGGERVLWSAINAISESHPEYHCIVYTGDNDISDASILETARLRFGMEVNPQRVTFIHLQTRPFVEAELYPRFTMLLQSLASLLMAVEALLSFVPNIFIDTMGYAFVLPVFCYMGPCPVAAYVHYPTISTDMLKKVENREECFNNSSNVSASALFSTAKLWYYRAFAQLYGMAGGCASVILTNSTWTYNHIVSLWWNSASERTRIVYPPCDVSALSQLSLSGRKNVIISVAQFRPEKNHALQLNALKCFKDRNRSNDQQVRGIFLNGGNSYDERENIFPLSFLLSSLSSMC